MIVLDRLNQITTNQAGSRLAPAWFVPAGFSFEAPMSNVVYGVDFKKANSKADRAFWLGPEETVAVTMPTEQPDTAPSEYCIPDDEPA